MRRARAKDWVGVLLLSVVFGSVEVAGQLTAPPPPPIPGRSPSVALVSGLVVRLQDQVKNLSSTINLDLNRNPARQALINDCDQIQTNARGLEETLRRQGPASAQRRDFDQIDRSWHQLRDRLTLPGLATTNLNRSAEQIDRTIDELRRALGYAADSLGDLEGLAKRMADDARQLARDIESELARQPDLRAIASDCRELETSLREYAVFAGRTNRLFALRQAYLGIDHSWAQLRGQLQRLGPGPNTARSIRRINESDLRIHDAIDLRTDEYGWIDGNPGLPPVTDPGRPVFPQYPDLAHLSLALLDRAETLAAVSRNELVNLPGGPDLIQNCYGLCRAVESYQRGLRPERDLNYLRNGYRGLATRADQLKKELSAARVQGPMRDAWRAYAYADDRIRGLLGLPSSPVISDTSLVIPTAPPVAELSARLQAEVDALIVAFAPTVNQVPEGREIFAEIERLRDATRGFSRDVSSNQALRKLAQSFAAVNDRCGRLSRRVYRVAAGRSGPNIQRVDRLVEICRQIGWVLGSQAVNYQPFNP